MLPNYSVDALETIAAFHNSPRKADHCAGKDFSASKAVYHKWEWTEIKQSAALCEPQPFVLK